MVTKTVTMRLPVNVYNQISSLAKEDNRPISNYLETIALRYIEQSTLVDEFEMKEIRENKSLLERIKKGHESVKKGRGRFA
jgi:predicted DNA-binding protein